MKLVRIMSVAMLVLLGAPLARNQQHDRRDGNWWITQEKFKKLNYMTGFFDGMELGNRFSYWDSKQGDKADGMVVAVYASNSEKYLNHVTNGQLVEGVDKFYSDFRNRRIMVIGAVWLVVNEIAGTPEAKMQSMIENWRKNADQ